MIKKNLQFQCIQTQHDEGKCLKIEPNLKIAFKTHTLPKFDEPLIAP